MTYKPLPEKHNALKRRLKVKDESPHRTAVKIGFHHKGTKYLPVHPVHKGEKKEE